MRLELSDKECRTATRSTNQDLKLRTTPSPVTFDQKARPAFKVKMLVEFQAWTLGGPLKHGNLLPQCEIFKGEVAVARQDRDHGSQ